MCKKLIYHEGLLSYQQEGLANPVLTVDFFFCFWSALKINCGIFFPCIILKSLHQITLKRKKWSIFRYKIYCIQTNSSFDQNFFCEMNNLTTKIMESVWKLIGSPVDRLKCTCTICLAYYFKLCVDPRFFFTKKCSCYTFTQRTEFHFLSNKYKAFAF